MSKITDNPEEFFNNLTTPKEEKPSTVTVKEMPVSEEEPKKEASISEDPTAFFSQLEKPVEAHKPETAQSVFLGQIAGKKPEQLETFDIQSLNQLAPDELHDVAMARKDLPLTDEQLRSVYDYHKGKAVTDANYGTPSSLREYIDAAGRWMEPIGKVGNEVAHTLWSAAKGAGKLAYATADYATAPSMASPEARANYTSQEVEQFRAQHKKKGESLEKAWQSAVEPIVGMPEELSWLGTKLGAGGFDWHDRASEALGLQDHEKSFQNFKARRAVDSAQAQYYMEHPSVYGRLMDLPAVKGGLEAIVKSQMPSADEWMASHPDLTKDQAQAQLDEIAKSHVDSQIKESEAKISESDPDIVTAGTFLAPEGLGMGTMGALGMGARVAGELAPKITQGLKFLGKTDAEINTMNAAAQALQREQQAAGLAAKAEPSMLEKAAGKTAEGIDWTGAKLKGLAEKIPAPIRPYVPYVAAGTAGGVYGHEQGRSVIGDVLHGIELAGLLKAPALVRDIAQARRISAGGTKGTFETMAGFPNVSEGAAKVIRFGGKNVDRLLDNAAEYTRAGIHGTALAVATGALESADPDTMNELVSNGLVYSLGGHAFQRIKGSITGRDPILERRKKAQQDVDNLKTYADLTPETKQTLGDLTDWKNVVASQQQKTTDAFTAYQDADARGAKNAEQLRKEYEAQQKALSSVMRANVQTRNEYGRLFVDQLSRNNQLVNGALRAGQNNVGIHILTTQQIFDQFRKDPANAGMTDADLKGAAEQAGFYSAPEGAIEYKAGMGMEAPKKDMVFDRTKPAVVINADHLKARMGIFGESATQALNHEIGHHVGNIPEFRESNKDAEAMLFSQDIKDPSGAVVATTSGRYSPKDLVEMYEKNYMSGKSPEQVEQLSKLAGLWDFSRGALDENAVAGYMRDEIIADLNAGTISRHLGKDLDSGTQHLMDVASLKTKKNLLERAIQKFAGLGGKGSAVSPLTGAEYSPDVLAANRQAMRALQSLQGEVSPAVAAPDAPKISRAEMMKNKALMERYGKYSGLFKTKVQAQMFDGNGKPVGAPIDISNPNAAEGSWQNKDGSVRQLNGYGQRPDEVSGIEIPEGGSLVVGRQVVTQADGKTPVLMEGKEAKNLQKARANVVRDALNTPDEGAPNRFEPTGDPDGTWRGTLTPLQIEAIKNLPEGIVPKSIKENILKINDQIIKGDGSRMLVDYAAVMNDAGRYTPYSAKIYDVVPIGMHLSKDGHFLVTTISIGRMFDKLNKWSERMPARLSPWNGSKDAFFKEFTEKYLQNWQNGLAGETGLSGTPAEAIAKKNIFNDFLNLATKDTAPLNPDRTKTPRRRGDVRGKDVDRTIMSMRLDHMAELIDNDGAPKVPVSYQKAKFNMMPAEPVVEQAMPEERKPSAIDLGITAARTPESRPFGAQYVAPQAQAPTPKSDLFFMPASAEIREQGSKQHLEFWNRELENSGIKEKPTTMEALEQYIYKNVAQKYKFALGHYDENAGKLFPTPDAEKIKNYYSKVVRNATPEQAINFPENWRRVRNMSDDEFDSFFSQDRVNEITKSRVQTLSKSANYLIGEMQQPESLNKYEIKEISGPYGGYAIYREGKPIEEIYTTKEEAENRINRTIYGDYTPAEVAAILDASAKVRVRTGKDENGNLIPVKQKITNGNEVVPNEVSGATASRIAEYMRQGMGSEEAYTKGVFDTMKARAEQRGTYTGWKKYDQSDDMGEAEKLNADVAGTNWCTGGAVSTAHQHLRGGDFYVYFDQGEPQVAIRTDDGQIAEVRGRGEGQNITTPKYDQAAEEFIRSGEGPEGGNEYLHDREFRKMAVQIMQTGEVPEEALKYYNQGGMFSAVKPKMSYKREFEPEYVEAFKTAVIPQSKIFDRKTGTLNTSLDYAYGDPENAKYKQVKGNIYLSDYIVDNKLELPNLEKSGDIVPKTDHKKLVSVKLPKLQEAGNIDVRRLSTSLQLPKLKKAGEIYAHSSTYVDLPKLEKAGDIIAQTAKALNVPKLKEAKTIDYNSVDGSEYNFNSLEKVGNMWTRGISALEMPNLKEAGLIYNGYLTRGYFPELKNVLHLDSATVIYAPKLEKASKINIQHRNELISNEVGFRAAMYAVPSGILRMTDVDTGKRYVFPAGKRGEFVEMLNETDPVKKAEIESDLLQKPALEPWQIRPDEKIVAATYSEPSLKGLSPEADSFRTGATHLEADPTASENRTERETDEYGFLITDSKGNENIVNRREAYEIAKANGQLKEPETLDEKVDNIRGVLHSDMVNYDGEGKGGQLQFMPSREEEPKNLVAVHNLSEENLRNVLKVGGLAVPSVAVIRNDRSDFTSFGEITLVAPYSMVDPKRDSKAKVFNADVYSPRYPRLDYFMPDKKANRQLLESIKESLDKMPADLRKRFFASIETEQADRPMRERFAENPIFIAAFLSDTGRIGDVEFSIPEDERYADQSARWNVREFMRSNPDLKEEFNNWIENKLDDAGATEEEKLFAGYTPSGTRRYVPHTLDNVVKMMAKSIRDGEGPNYGVGSVRSKAAKQFSTLEQVKNAREQIVSKDRMEELKAEVNDEFEELAQESIKLRNVQRDFYFDQIADDMKALAEGGSENMNYLKEQYPNGAPFEKWRNYLDKLRNLPTEYFEAKIQRGVGLEEFAGAVVPKETNQDVIDSLEKRGIEVIKYDERNEGSRAQAIRNIGAKRSDIAFMPYSPELPKNEDGKVDWAAFQTKTQEIAKPLAGLSFSPSGLLVDKGDQNSLPVYQETKNGKPKIVKGNPVFVKQDYDLVNAPAIVKHDKTPPEDATPFDFNSLAYDVTKPQQKKINEAIASGAVDSIVNKVVAKTEDYLKNQEIAAGKGWYSRMRENLLNALGEDGRELLSQLLGATSAKTPVNQNFLQAMDAYEGIKEGRYDKNRESYLEMMSAEEKGELDQLIQDRGYESDVLKIANALSTGARKLKGKKKEAALGESAELRKLIKKPVKDRTAKDRQKIMMLATQMMPMRSNGKKFNANSMAVMKVIAGTWLANRNSPKTPNFAGNLSGRTIQATIDVWAARHLRQAMYEGYGQPWRIQPKSETGVSNPDFALGQIIFKRAADKLGMNPDDLQAVLWFAEKHNWEDRGWTKNEGAEKSSFDEIFHVFFPKGKKPLSFFEASKKFESLKEEESEDTQESDES